MRTISYGSYGRRVAFLVGLVGAAAGCAADAGDTDKSGGSSGDITGSTSGSTSSGAGTTGTSYGSGTSSGSSSGASTGSTSGASTGTSGTSGITGTTGTIGGSGTIGGGTTGASTTSGTSAGSTGTSGSASTGTTGTTSGATGADSGPALVLTPSSLEVQFVYSGSNVTAISNAQFTLDVFNYAATAAPLGDITIRYWFSSDGYDPSTFGDHIYYAGLVGPGTDITSDVSAKFVAAPSANVTATSDTYIELSFASGAGSLAKNGDATIQVGFNGPGYQDLFDETNDYSFEVGDTTVAQDPYATAYFNGTLVWGVEPGIPPEVDAGAEDASEGDGESTIADAGVDATLNDSGGSESPDATEVDAGTGDAAPIDAAPVDAGAPAAVDAATE